MNKRVVNLFLLVALVMGLMVGCGTEPTAVPAEPTAAPAAPTAAAAEPVAEGGRLILATTTSTQDSGLLDVILPDFEQQAGVSVEVIAVGTGQAIELGEAGDADVLLVHARSREDAFMADGHGVRREDVMYNDFIIVGPASDPAGVAGMTDAGAALTQIAKAEAPFISRGDDSGTHTKELSVWKAAGIEPAGAWYISAGQGMGEVLTMADEQEAYALSDRATYLARTLEGTDLQILVEGDKVLFNPYGVLAVNPDKSAKINNELANQFIDWIISMPTQELIGQFGVDEFGAPLFTPDSALWREANPAGDGGQAALQITGSVANQVSWTEEEVRAMPTIDAQATNKDGETKTYTGVPINDLLALAGPNADATTVVLVADDGFSAEATLAEVQGCADCIVAFQDGGGFRIVMPGFSNKLQVKGVVEIQVK